MFIFLPPSTHVKNQRRCGNWTNCLYNKGDCTTSSHLRCRPCPLRRCSMLPCDPPRRLTSPTPSSTTALLTASTHRPPDCILSKQSVPSSRLHTGCAFSLKAALYSSVWRSPLPPPRTFKFLLVTEGYTCWYRLRWPRPAISSSDHMSWSTSKNKPKKSIAIITVRCGSWQPFPLKSQILHIYGFVGHVVSVTITQLCWGNTKACIDMWINVCVPIKLYLHNR